MIERATAVIRRGSEEWRISGYAFSLEKVCWFFVPDADAPEHKLFGKRTRIVLDARRTGNGYRARVIRPATARALAEKLSEMARGLL